ncbi:NUDIX hydrolase [Hyphomicrobium sp.]|uniref:NUDIX hydrolase n=1 Tax=Hyphomicrobium sp. TaxID=82 RepID=UPI003F6ED4A8
MTGDPQTSARTQDDGTPRAPANRLRPRDAATLIVVDWSAPEPRILMGRRRPDQVFLPDTYVFPGGRVDPGDRALARHARLPASESACVQTSLRGKPSDARAAALALAAVRETFEETGILIGAPGPVGTEHATKAGGWDAFLATGFRPCLDHLTYFARAITPPARPRRYDTRFFVVDADRIAHRTDAIDGELLDIGWFTVSDAKALKLPSITRVIMQDIATFIALTEAERRVVSVPSYAHRRGVFYRTLQPR